MLTGNLQYYSTATSDEAVSVDIYARTQRDNGYYYRSPSKTFYLRGYYVVPNKKYSTITMDITKEVYLGSGSKTINISDDVMYYLSSYGGLPSINLGTSSVYKDNQTSSSVSLTYGNFRGTLTATVNSSSCKIYLTFNSTVKNTTTATFTKTYYLTVKNQYTSCFITIVLQHKGKNAYTSGQNTTYASSTPIVTYS